MKCYAKSSENLIVQLANLPPKPPFLSKSFHLFSCTGKTHYLCISSAKNKEQNKTFLPFNFQNIGRQLVQYAASGNNIGSFCNGSYPKMIQTGHGESVISIPRDCNGQFEPITVPKHESRGFSIEKLIISL